MYVFYDLSNGNQWLECRRIYHCESPHYEMDMVASGMIIEALRAYIPLKRDATRKYRFE